MQDWNHGGHLKDLNWSLAWAVGLGAEVETIDEIMNEADQEMYAAKARRKVGRAASVRTPASAAFKSTSSSFLSQTAGSRIPPDMPANN